MFKKLVFAVATVSLALTTAVSAQQGRFYAGDDGVLGVWEGGPRTRGGNQGGGNQGGGNQGGGQNLGNQGGGGNMNIRAQSGGGTVRSGPGTGYRRITSLRDFENIRVVRNTGVMFNGYPWFEIRFRNGRRGFQWGGLICSTNRPFSGTFDTCANYRASLGGNQGGGQNTGNNGGNQGGGFGNFPLRAQTGGGVVRSGPGTNFRRITSLGQFENIRVMRNTGVMMNGYPWFQIRFRGGRRGHMWGGIICSTNQPFSGTFDTCANYRASLGGNQNLGNNGGNQGGGSNGNFPLRAQTGGGVVRSGPGTTFRKIASLGQFENIRVMRNTGVMMNGYPWFQIRFRGGRQGHMWGGIICSTNRPFSGTFDTCANFRNTLSGNNSGGGQNSGNPPVQVNTVNYRCRGGAQLVVEFRNSQSMVSYSFNRGPRRSLPALRTGSGMRFGDGFRELRGKGNQITLSEGGRVLARCRS